MAGRDEENKKQRAVHVYVEKRGRHSVGKREGERGRGHSRQTKQADVHIHSRGGDKQGRAERGTLSQQRSGLQVQTTQHGTTRHDTSRRTHTHKTTGGTRAHSRSYPSDTVPSSSPPPQPAAIRASATKTTATRPRLRVSSIAHLLHARVRAVREGDALRARSRWVATIVRPRRGRVRRIPVRLGIVRAVRSSVRRGVRAVRVACVRRGLRVWRARRGRGERGVGARGRVYGDRTFILMGLFGAAFLWISIVLLIILAIKREVSSL